MPALAVGDVLEMTILSRLYGQRCMNLFHYQVNDASTSEDYITTMLAVLNWFKNNAASPYTAIQGLTTEEVHYELLRAQVIYPLRRRFVSINPENDGALATETLPVNTAAHIERWTLIGDRGGHGGIHVAGLPAGLQSMGVFTGPGIVTLNTIAATLVNPVNVPEETLTAIPILYSAARAPLFRTVVGTTVQTTLRTMRRRTVGLGE